MAVLVAPPVHRANLAQHPTSAALARRFVDVALASWGLGPLELVDCVRLLTSELVTNAVVHARSPAVLDVSRAHGAVRVEVRDRIGVLPSARPAAAMARSGRGLVLVNALALRWGSYATDDGDKVVWFEVPEPSER